MCVRQKWLLFGKQSIESRLKVVLPDDLGTSLMDGVVLCHLANHIRPRSVISIHVPSPAVVSPHPPPSLLLCAAQGMERFPQVAVQFRLRSFSSWFPFDFGRSYAYKKTTTTFWTVELDYCHIGALLRQKQHENETRISNRQNCLA